MRYGMGAWIAGVAVLAVIFFGTATMAGAGTLQFYASGEELATGGFTGPQLTKDGWALHFDHVFVTLEGITARQTDPPYDPRAQGTASTTAKILLDGVYTIDLAAGAVEEPPRFVGEVGNAPAGHYNALSWRMVKAAEGPSRGYSFLMIGTAEKQGKRTPFRIAGTGECEYRCGEFVGDERKGILRPGGAADLEMTFHLDHIFGRADVPADDDMNLAAPGFAPFAVEGAGIHEIDIGGMHLGHVGEGHCAVLVQ